MKKILALLFMFVALTGLVSCNDDGTENDAPYTARLVGSWQMSNSNDELTIQSGYRFDSHSSFVYSYSSMNLKDITMRTWSIRGAWNVKKGVLQLSYDLETFRADGYSATEIKEMEAGIRDHNLLLSEMNQKGRPFGPTISFVNVDGKEMLKLSDVNGYYERVGN